MQSVARVAQVLSDNGLQAEAFIQRADQNQAGIGVTRDQWNATFRNPLNVN